MLSLIRPAVVSMAFFTLLLGLAYPLLITGVGQAAFPKQANGSLVVEGGKVVGSELVGRLRNGLAVSSSPITLALRARVTSSAIGANAGRVSVAEPDTLLTVAPVSGSVSTV